MNYSLGILTGITVMYLIYITYSFDWINDHIGLPLAEAYVTITHQEPR